MSRVFNPREAPSTYDSDAGSDHLIVSVGAIPLVGIPVRLGSLMWALGNRDNPFNLANEAWNSSILVFFSQLIWTVALVVGWVVAS